jgi:hypothetical protein
MIWAPPLSIRLPVEAPPSSILPTVVDCHAGVFAAICDNDSPGILYVGGDGPSFDHQCAAGQDRSARNCRAVWRGSAWAYINPASM